MCLPPLITSHRRQGGETHNKAREHSSFGDKEEKPCFTFVKRSLTLSFGTRPDESQLVLCVTMKIAGNLLPADSGWHNSPLSAVVGIRR